MRKADFRNANGSRGAAEDAEITMERLDNDVVAGCIRSVLTDCTSPHSYDCTFSQGMRQGIETLVMLVSLNLDSIEDQREFIKKCDCDRLLK